MSKPVDTQSEVSPTLQPRPRPRIPVPLAVVIAAALLFVVVHPFDAALASLIDRWTPTGDLKREWSALQQFGQGSSLVLIALLILLLDPDRRRRVRLLDFAAALALVGLVVTAMKMLIGRPRPRFGDATTFLFPWGTYPVEIKNALGEKVTVQAHAWDWSIHTHAQLWSMPSSHTAFAAATALFLSMLYPRIRWLVAVLAAIVAGGRLVFDAHWPTDVLIGAAAGVAIAWPVLRWRKG